MFERECVNLLNAQGVFAERVPLSGAAGGSFSADLQVTLGGNVRKVECKIRKRAWSELYAWLKGNYALFIRANNEDPLVVMRMSDFIAQHKVEW
jgi:Holliday junction resolvase